MRHLPSLAIAAALMTCCGRKSVSSGEPVDDAIRWIAAHKDRAPGNGARCEPDGFCGESIRLGRVTLSSVALEHDPRSFVYGWFTGSDLTCARFGAHRIVREADAVLDDAGPPSHFVECELDDPSLSGLRALVTTGKSGDSQLDKIGCVEVFSPTPAVLRHLERGMNLAPGTL